MSLTFDCDTPFCFTGALVEAELDGVPVFSYFRYTAKVRQTLTLKRIIKGNYTYLCVAGGFLVPQVQGSASTDLRAQFGGYQGRMLKAGDCIPPLCVIYSYHFSVLNQLILLIRLGRHFRLNMRRLLLKVVSVFSNRDGFCKITAVEWATVLQKIR